VSIDIDANGKFVACTFHKMGKDSALPRKWFPFIQPTNAGKPSIAIHKLEHLLGAKFRTIGKAESRTVTFQVDAACQMKRDALAVFATWCAKRILCAPVTAWSHFINDAEQIQTLKNEIEKRAREHVLTSAMYAAVYVDEKPWWEGIAEFWLEEARDVSDAMPDFKGKRTDLLRKGEPRTSIVEPVMGQCLVCGAHSLELERLVPSFDALTWAKQDKKAFIKVVPDMLKFTSFNRAAYTSRCLQKAYNAPICRSCADRAAKGWNGLVGNPNSRDLVEGLVLVFWGDVVGKSWARHPDPKVWRDLMMSPIQGIAKRIGPQGIRVIGLGAHESSAYVTIWLQKDADAVARAVVRWATWQLFLREEQDRMFSLTDLVLALRERHEPGRPRAGSLSKHEMRFWRDLLYLSYGVGSIPPYVVHRLGERFSAEVERLSEARDRLALLNTCLCSLNDWEVIDLNNLTHRQHNAMNAGRIFKLICFAQEKAIGDAGKTILASNARLAATRPSQIIGELMIRLNQVYMPKLKRDKRGLYVWIDVLAHGLQRETEILDRHSPEEVCWFWRGFYDADFHAEYERYKEEKKEGRN
jgi:hypothetical protein